MEAQKWLTALEEKIEKWGVPKEAETEQMERMISALERLEELLTQIESSLKLKLALNEKMENIIARINRLTWPGEELPAPKKTLAPALEDTLAKVINRAKLASRVLDALVSAVQMSLESAQKMREKGKDEGDGEQQDKPADNRSNREQPELQSILQPLGTLVQNVVEEKIKGMQAEEKRAEG